MLLFIELKRQDSPKGEICEGLMYKGRMQAAEVHARLKEVLRDLRETVVGDMENCGEVAWIPITAAGTKKLEEVRRIVWATLQA